MASRWKTFTPNSTLPAADINDCLNPAAADHIPRAQAIGSQNITTAASATNDTVLNLPTDRFTVTPRVFVSPAGAAALNVTVFVVTATTTTATVRIRNNTASPQTITLYWHAIQM